jgi:hypothetical protein
MTKLWSDARQRLQWSVLQAVRRFEAETGFGAEVQITFERPASCPPPPAVPQLTTHKEPL